MMLRSTIRGKVYTSYRTHQTTQFICRHKRYIQLQCTLYNMYCSTFLGIWWFSQSLPCFVTWKSHTNTNKTLHFVFFVSMSKNASMLISRIAIWHFGTFFVNCNVKTEFAFSCWWLLEFSPFLQRRSLPLFFSRAVWWQFDINTVQTPNQSRYPSYRYAGLEITTENGPSNVYAY